MEGYSKKIIDNIKQEAETENEILLVQLTQPKVIGDIKHEPERHFVFIMPEDPEPEINEVRKVKIVLRKFDRKWKSTKPEMFETYTVCDKCDYAVKNSSDLKKHLKTCKIQKCENCFLMSKSEIIKKCVYCDLKFDCSNCQSNHVDRDHRNGSIWHCNKCDFKTLKKLSLKGHYRDHVNKFSCETCKKQFSRQQQLKNHQQQHRHGVFASEPEIKFECQSCVRSFATKKGLNVHVTYFHSKMNFHCDICGKIKKTKSYLRTHMLIHVKVPCPICQHMVAEYRIEEHIEQHSSSTKFKCDECNKVFFKKKQLSYHKKIIHEIDQVQCDLCSKTFNNKGTLRLHMKYHL